VTVWGFFAVVVAAIVGAWAYLRRRVEVVSVDGAQREAMDRARSDAADASIQRQRAAAMIAAEGEAKAQASAVVARSTAAEDAVRLAGDLRSQADAVADMIGAAPSRRDTNPGHPGPK
jgi:hypothetical protein